MAAKKKTANKSTPVKVTRDTGLSFEFGSQMLEWSSGSPLRFDASVMSKDNGVTLIVGLTRGNLCELRELFEFAIKHTDAERDRMIDESALTKGVAR